MIESVPSEKQMNAAYSTLNRRAGMSVHRLAQILPWVRFDARLGELWLLKLAKHWKNLSPVELREANLKNKSPAVLGVLLEQFSDFYCNPAEKSLFRQWMKLVLLRTPPAKDECFFVGIQKFAGKERAEDAKKPLKSFRKWGFLGREVFVNKALQKMKQKQATLLAPEVRMEILLELMKSRSRFQINDYIQACGGAISRRMAQIDLSKIRPPLKRVGNTRGRFYLKT